MEDYPLVLAPVSQVPPFPQGEDLKGPERVRRMLDERKGFLAKVRAYAAAAQVDDADAAGLAEITYGAGRGQSGAVLLLTLALAASPAIAQRHLVIATESGVVSSWSSAKTLV